MKKKTSQTKKTLLILHPYTFTEFKYYQYELLYLVKKKNYKVIIHDLSSISSNKEYDKIWKTKREKRAIVFPSLLSWISAFNKIRKRKNILIYDFLHYGEVNFQVFIVELFLMFSQHPILKPSILDVPSYISKKNLRFYLSKILKYKLNLKTYFIKIKEKFFSTLIKLIKFKKIFIMTNKDFNPFENKKNINLIKGHSFDYSNSLLKKYNNSNKINKKKYIVYLDIGIPYFAGDATALRQEIKKVDNESYYRDLNLYFDELEKLYKAKVIVIPHSKYKITKLKNKNLNPYFNNRLTDNSYNATAKLIPKCLFVTSHGSTALSYAIINYKSVRFLYTKSYNLYDGAQDKDILLQAKILGAKTVDFVNVKKKDLFRSLKVNKAKYDLYKYEFLTYKSKKPVKSIHKIIEDLMNQLFKKNKFKLQ